MDPWRAFSGSQTLKKEKEAQSRMQDLGARLNAAILRQVQQLKKEPQGVPNK
jgi:hypothetical protein